jgi:adenylate kinase
MNIILSGPQGSGKGTQADLLAAKLNLVHLESGKMFRQIISSDSPLGKKVASFVNRGILVPDDVVFEMVKTLFTPETLTRGFIIDGFPRTTAQIQWLDQELAAVGSKVDVLIYLKLSRPEALRRLSARRNCPKCGRIYNMLTQPPKKDELCDDDQTQLVTRADETPEAINKRLDEYEKQTAPMIAYYQAQNKVLEINGEQPINVIFEEILQKLKL